MIRHEHRLPGEHEHAGAENTSRSFPRKNHDPDRSEEAGGGDVTGVCTFRPIMRPSGCPAPDGIQAVVTSTAIESSPVIR